MKGKPKKSPREKDITSRYLGGGMDMDDGSATFATDINSNLLVGVALHELTHAMGRVPYGPSPDIFDLFRFTSPGARLFAGGNTAPAAYFSIDGGNTKLADFGQLSDPSDFLTAVCKAQTTPSMNTIRTTRARNSRPPIWQYSMPWASIPR